jgi:lipopolysaccharide export system protein LptA
MPVGLVTPTAAQGLAIGGDKKQPIEITAEKGLEWRQKEERYIARGNAKAVQGTSAVYADTLIAYYRQVAGGATEIYRIDAEGNVRIASPTETAYGDIGVYYIKKGELVLKGKALKLVTASEIITARDSLEYFEQKNLAVARGNAMTKSRKKGGSRTIRADVLSADFASGAGGTSKGGAKQLERIRAFGNVIITRPDEISRGSRGIYYPNRDIANLEGNVRITRGQNQINGERAVVNFRTGISRLLGGTGKAPVKALIVPNGTTAPANKKNSLKIN